MVKLPYGTPHHLRPLRYNATMPWYVMASLPMRIA